MQELIGVFTLEWNSAVLKAITVRNIGKIGKK